MSKVSNVRFILSVFIFVDAATSLKTSDLFTSPKEWKHHRETWTPVTCHWIRSILGLLGPLEGYLFDNNIYFVLTYLPSDSCAQPAQRKIEIIGAGRCKLCQE
jgi:hypothetical protein